MTPSPARIIEAIQQRLLHDKNPLLVAWVQVPDNRSHYKDELRRLRGSLPIVPIVLRGALFSHSNALMNDLAEVIGSHRNEFELLDDIMLTERKAAIVLISCIALSLPQVSSPALLPEWFPFGGGSTVYVTIEDITWKVDAPISAGEACVEELCELLFVLEGSLLVRLQKAHDERHNSGNALFQLIRADPSETYPDFLAKAVEFRQTINNPSGFRPSAKEGRSLTARLMRVGSSTSADALLKPSKALRDALALNSIPLSVADSLITVLMRPTNRDPDDSTRLARNLLVTLYACSQFATAAAHADYYSRYPVSLLRSISFNLRSTLRELEQVLAALA